MSDWIPFNILKEMIRKFCNIKSLIPFRLVFNRQNKKMMPHIPFDIQMEIMKRLPVKPLIRFRSVSKPWKSFIDTSEFIRGYTQQPHSFTSILSYREPFPSYKDNCICFVDDDDNHETLFKVAQSLVVSPLVKEMRYSTVIGACHGLLCLRGSFGLCGELLVIWNPSIRKSIGILIPFDSESIIGFGVCPVTRDPTVVKLRKTLNGMSLSWQVEVFTLSSGVWNLIPSSNSPRDSIRFNDRAHVVIDRFIYWGALERTYDDDYTLPTVNHMVVSFDLITKEFRVIDLPGSLTNELYGDLYEDFFVSVCKLRESLVVSGYIMVGNALCCGVWVRDHDSSFRKLYTIGASVGKILGFRKSGKPIFEVPTGNYEVLFTTTVDVYDPCSQQIKNLLGIVGSGGSFFMGSYEESLLLLDHSDLHIYHDKN